MRALGRMHNYYPEDITLAYKVDSILDAVNDIIAALLKAIFEADPEKKKEAFAKVLSDTLPKYFGALEKRLVEQGHENFLVGDSLTIADFVFSGFLASFPYNEGNPNSAQFKEVYEQYPKLWQYAVNMQTVFKEYLDARPQPRFM